MRTAGCLEEIVTKCENALFRVAKDSYRYAYAAADAMIDFLDYISDPIIGLDRIGKDGKKFVEYKFRTMQEGAGKEFGRLAKENGLDELGKPKGSKRTWYGNILSQRFIDELPQLYNVFVSRDMGFVGMRPQSKDSLTEYAPDIQRKYQRYGGNFIGIQYAEKTKDFTEMQNLCRRWFRDYEQAPVSASLRWGTRVLYNIIFKGYRSR